VISDCVSLSDKERREVPAFVAEDGTIDAGLATVIDEPAPGEQCVAFKGAQDDLFAWPDEQGAASPVFVAVGAVVALIEGKAGSVAILGEPPKRPGAKGSITRLPP
jgi:hypothetical protein